MKASRVTQKWSSAICSSVVVVGVVCGAEPQKVRPTAFQWITVEPGFDSARFDAVGKAVGFGEWPQTEVRRVAPPIDRSLLSDPELVTRESTYYDLVEVGQGLWAEREWSCDRMVEADHPLPRELPPHRKEELLAMLSPGQRGDAEFVERYLKRKLDRYRESQKHRLDGELEVQLFVAPNSRAAQEHLLLGLVTNSLPTEVLVDLYSSATRPEGLGVIAFLTEGGKGSDVNIRFVQDNVHVRIRARGCFASKAASLARNVEAMLGESSPLTYEGLLARRPVVTIAPQVDEAATQAMGQRTVSYAISVPVGEEVVWVGASVDGQPVMAKDGKIHLESREGRFTVRVAAISSELLANTVERELISE